MQEFDQDKWGVSFSIKQCRNFGLDSDDVLKWLIDVGFRRFRLMSYWDEHEVEKGVLDFKSLDEQITTVGKTGGNISLCLGVRQPRWPENHWPAWALELDSQLRTEAIFNYVESVIRRYQDNPAIKSYQLENEALLKSFGENPDIDRKRLRREMALVKRLDPARRVIMTTSTSWGIPLIGPIPDIVGFSFYQVMFNNRKNKYTLSFHKPWLDRLRAHMIKIIWGKDSFIHELQLDPWGPHAIWEMNEEEQNKSMSTSQIRKNIRLASSIGLSPIDLWGGEWWYWRMIKEKDPSIWQTVQEEIATN
ncbi:MAG TPA: hypothetical protein VD947_00395 [Patescibacteria group bacterium]|nr:hypothetical protein [Patescibacteria group bacterium]